MLDWLKPHVPSWYFSGPLTGVETRTVFDPYDWQNTEFPSMSPRVGWGVIVDEDHQYVLFSHPPTLEEENEITCDIRRIYPTSVTFFEDVLLSIAIIDKRMRAECCCGIVIPGIKTMVG